MTPADTHFTDADDASVFRQISGNHGLSADVDLTGPTHKCSRKSTKATWPFCANAPGPLMRNCGWKVTNSARNRAPRPQRRHGQANARR